ncbi:MAG: ATP-binding cassette domain-containing protein [Candidatus Oleimicrobiaceae bacterium]
MAQRPPDILIADLWKTYGQVEAVRGLSLAVAPGRLFGLVGPDGAGKTTTLRVLCGLLKADKGQCLVRGYDVAAHPRRVKSMLGYMPQRFSLYPDLTVAENLRFFSDLFHVPRAEREARVAELLAFSRLGPFQRRRAADLSGGMKQKLALCCTLIHTPAVLLLDEPTTGVDPVSRREFWRILRRLRDQGVTILLTTPYMDEAARCDEVGFMHKGRLIAQGPPRELEKLVRSHLLEVRCARLLEAARLLHGRPGIDTVHVLGDYLHVGTNRPRLARQVITNQLQQAGIALHSVTRVMPSIEDVFVELMRE